VANYYQANKVWLNQAADYGDAPDPTFPTLHTSNGALHVIVPGFYLGAGVDLDSDGQPTTAADGDDTDTGGNDDDGVTLAGLLVQGQTTTVTITASAAGLVDA